MSKPAKSGRATDVATADMRRNAAFANAAIRVGKEFTKRPLTPAEAETLAAIFHELVAAVLATYGPPSRP
jgi:hypothetical protein